MLPRNRKPQQGQVPEPAAGGGHLLPRRLPAGSPASPASGDTPDAAASPGPLVPPGGVSLLDAGAPLADAATSPRAVARPVDAASPASPDRPEEPAEPEQSAPGGEAAEHVAVQEADTELLEGASGRERSRRPRRRLRRWLVAVSVLLVLVLGGVLACSQAERIARRTVQEQVLAAVQRLSADAAVDLGPGRLLPQLWAGELRGFTVTASSLQLGAGSPQAQGLSGPLTLSGIEVQVTGMGTKSPHRARELWASGSLSWEQVSALATAHLKGSGSSAAGVVGGVRLQQAEDGAPDSLLVAVDVPAATLQATGTLSITSQGDLQLSLSEVEVRGGPLPFIGLPKGEALLEKVGVPQTMTVLAASGLPEGLQVASVETAAAGVTVGLSGQDVALDNLGK